ncbi:MAG: potassium channel family protein, partial [Phycisphaerales bacterium]
LFWSISDYGLRTWRIILWFFGLALVFALAYFLWPNCVTVNERVGEIRGFVHALYFSVVTMTTLGFGDIAANPDSWQGQVLLMVQVILGYVLLGALVTRFAVLFTAGGPAGKFKPMNKETKELLKRLEEEKRLRK